MQLTIISGASSGIGEAIASQAEADGHSIATISRRPGPGTYLEADLSDPAGWPEVSAWIDAQVQSQDWSRVVFVHNAGVVDPIGFAGESAADQYTTNILLNAASPVVLGAGFLASVAKIDAPSHLMLISSGAGRRPIKGWSSYCAGKAATDMWAQAAGMEQAFRGSNATVIAIAPGVVDTGMQSVIRSQNSDAFPDIENFIQLKEGGALSSATEVAATLLALAAVNAGEEFRSVRIENGAILSISDFS